MNVLGLVLLLVLDVVPVLDPRPRPRSRSLRQPFEVLLTARENVLILLHGTSIFREDVPTTRRVIPIERVTVPLLDVNIPTSMHPVGTHSLAVPTSKPGMGMARGKMGITPKDVPIMRVIVPISPRDVPKDEHIMGTARRNRLAPCAGVCPPACPMGKKNARPLGGLFLDVQNVLSSSQETMGQRFGASRKTVGRWQAGRSQPDDATMREIIHAVHPEAPDLAAELATYIRETPESLGLVAPPAPPRDPDPPVSPRHTVDSIVCVAAEAMDLPPRAVRPAVLAAFKRARELRLDVKTVEESLSPESKKG